eukprot:15443470-Alexandrium_andersonii.AAC.1
MGAVDLPVELVSDSRYVVNGIASLAAGACAGERARACAWARVAPHVRSGRLQARWTPALLETA